MCVHDSNAKTDPSNVQRQQNSLERKETAPDRKQKLETHPTLEKVSSSPRPSPASFSWLFFSKTVESTIKTKMGKRRFCSPSFLANWHAEMSMKSHIRFEATSRSSSCLSWFHRSTHLGFFWMHSVRNQRAPTSPRRWLNQIFFLCFFARSDYLFTLFFWDQI